MSGRHSFSELTKDFSPERKRKVEAIKSEIQAEITLNEPRRARSLSRGESISNFSSVGEPEEPEFST